MELPNHPKVLKSLKSQKEVGQTPCLIFSLAAILKISSILRGLNCCQVVGFYCSIWLSVYELEILKSLI
jgi:hypothetical protein